MFKAALFAIVVAACGGTSKPASTDTTTTTTSASTPAPDPKAEEPKQPEGPGAEALAQAALAEQYELGKKIYGDKDCDSCHGDNGEGNPKNPPVIGDKAFPEQPLKTAKLRKGVTFKTAKDVMDFVKAKMPLKSPNTLTDDEAAAVTAWLLSESKVNITQKLDASNAANVSLRSAP
jgi:cytochrome c